MDGYWDAIPWAIHEYKIVVATIIVYVLIVIVAYNVTNNK